jgi:hypothetical protein
VFVSNVGNVAPFIASYLAPIAVFETFPLSERSNATIQWEYRVREVCDRDFARKAKRLHAEMLELFTQSGGLQPNTGSSCGDDVYMYVAFRQSRLSPGWHGGRRRREPIL